MGFWGSSTSVGLVVSVGWLLPAEDMALECWVRVFTLLPHLCGSWWHERCPAVVRVGWPLLWLSVMRGVGSTIEVRSAFSGIVVAVSYFSPSTVVCKAPVEVGHVGISGN
ncbi:hypothetical protein U1Q18_010475 [Sarracenia purpurea var. burkii]